MDYLIRTAAEVPTIEIGPLITTSPVHELGTNGIGEGDAIGSTAAVANAIADALSVRDGTPPVTLDHVLSLIRVK